MDQIPEEGVILVSATARTHMVTVFGMAYHMMHLQLANESLTRGRAPLHPVAQRWIHAQRYGRAKRTHTGKNCGVPLEDS